MIFESFPNTKYLLPSTQYPIPDHAPLMNDFSLTLSEIEDSPNIRLPFGIDLSKHNTSADGKQKVDFDIIAATIPPYVAFIAMRAGISWGYQDPWFNYYFSEGMRIKRILMPYHVLYPGELATRQMDNFFRILGDIDYKTTPLVLDLELDHGQSVSKITNTTLHAISIIVQRTGRIPIIYSRAQWVNTFLKVIDLPPVYWWLAQYRYSLPFPLYTPEYPCPPTLPLGVHTWLFHQTTQRGRSIGAPGLYFMDHNRFNGTMEELNAFAVLASPGQTLATCPLDSVPCAAGKTIASNTPIFRVQLSAPWDHTKKELVRSPGAGGGLHASLSVGDSFLKDKNKVLCIKNPSPLAASPTTPPLQGGLVGLPSWIGHKQNFSRLNRKDPSS